MNKLKNPYVLIGLALIGVYFYKRNTIKKSKPKNLLSEKKDKADEKEPEKPKTLEEISKETDLPLPFLKDVEKMSEEEKVKTINANVESMNRSKDLTSDKKNHLLKMVKYINSKKSCIYYCTLEI